MVTTVFKIFDFSCKRTDLHLFKVWLNSIQQYFQTQLYEYIVE